MPRLEDYRFGRLIVDGEEQTRDMIVLPKRVVTDWWRANGHRLIMDDLEDVRAELPEQLVVGTGAYGQMRPDPDVVEQLQRGGGSRSRRYPQRMPCAATANLIPAERQLRST
jgi:hypothetical protein